MARAESSEPGRGGLEKLLELLDPDPAKAAAEYEALRKRLGRLFEWRGARDPETLVDETISRVARRLEDGVEVRASDPYRYFCGVAHMVFKETLRERRRQRKLDDPANWPQEHFLPEEPEDPRLELLRECLEDLGGEQRELILEYHRGEGRERIENRRAIARRLGIPLNALRIRVHRIRTKLEEAARERIRSEEPAES